MRNRKGSMQPDRSRCAGAQRLLLASLTTETRGKAVRRGSGGGVQDAMEAPIASQEAILQVV